MNVRNYMLRLSLPLLVLCVGGMIPVQAAESIQVLTRGKPDVYHDAHSYHKKKVKKAKHHQKHYLSHIPRHYSRIYHNKKCYYYHDGAFYRPCHGGRFELFRPYLGMIVPLLPQYRVQPVRRRGQALLLCDGVFYKRIHTRSGIHYKVVGFV